MHVVGEGVIYTYQQNNYVKTTKLGMNYIKKLGKKKYVKTKNRHWS